MTDNLKLRLDSLVDSLTAADISTRETLLEELERVVFELEARGETVPDRARQHVRAECDDAVEDQFDNLPV